MQIQQQEKTLEKNQVKDLKLANKNTAMLC